MTGETAARNAECLLFLLNVPEDNGLVARGGNDHVRVVDRSGDGRHHIRMGPHGALEGQRIRHFCCFSGTGNSGGGITKEQ